MHAVQEEQYNRLPEKDEDPAWPGLHEFLRQRQEQGFSGRLKFRPPVIEISDTDGSVECDSLAPTEDDCDDAFDRPKILTASQDFPSPLQEGEYHDDDL